MDEVAGVEAEVAGGGECVACVDAANDRVRNMFHHMTLYSTIPCQKQDRESIACVGIMPGSVVPDYGG